MQQQDQIEKKDAERDDEIAPIDALTKIDEENEQTSDELEEKAQTEQIAQPRKGFDWVALLVALIIPAFFALMARFNSQPSPSFTSAAIFSATGSGLLITALRKLRSRTGAGLREAALAGFGMALFQFAIAFTYPNIYQTITTAPEYGRAFLVTWGLIGLFAVVLSLAGAAIGHLAFAPLRPLPDRKVKQSSVDEDDEIEDEEEVEEADAQSTQAALSNEQDEVSAPQAADESDTSSTEQATEEEDEDAQEEEEDEEAELVGAGAVTQPRRSLVSSMVTVLLLALLPMMVGYVFAATYDFIMQAINVDKISPALYPTLSLFSGLLPWRLAAPINLASANGSFIVFTLLWRIPDSVLGNPNLFDVQTLEPLLFNAIALALLLITMYRSEMGENKRQAAPWGVFLLLQALLGLILVLPADLWMLRGLEGILQLQSVAIQLPTFHLLNTTLFILNLATGVLFCVLVGLIIRRQYQLWTTPRKETAEEPEELEASEEQAV